MLVLDRDTNETVNIGENIEVTILRINKKKVRLGIKAPRNIQVLRNEIFRKVNEQEQGQGGCFLNRVTPLF